jgi:hypothetical protein
MFRVHNAGVRVSGIRQMGHVAMAALAIMLGVCAQARAGLIINPIFDSTITNDPNAAAIEGTINSAIGVFERTFTNPITVNINFAESTNISLGENRTFLDFGDVTYAQFRAALAAQPPDAVKTTALAHLPNTTTDPVLGKTHLDIRVPNARALGLNINPPPGMPDSFILLNTSRTFPGSPGSSSVFDLMSVTEHEIDEALGLGSSLQNNPPGGSPPFGQIMPEDLYRYDQNGNRSFTGNTATVFFSLDGTTDLAQFNNQANGLDYGDWQSTPLPPGVAPQVQDAEATPFATPTLGPNEIAALEAIGYTLALPATAAPEPASLTLLGTGILLVSTHRWRGRKARRKAS